MTSTREALGAVGQAISIKELARQRNDSFPLSLRSFVGAHLIKHVFVLMLENRSFDHMLGFSGIQGTDATTGKHTTIEGLTGTESNSFTDSNGVVHTRNVVVGAADVMEIGPGHEFLDVFEQLCGPDIAYKKGDPYPDSISNSGFVSSYADTVRNTILNRKKAVLGMEGTGRGQLTSAEVKLQLAALDKLASKLDPGDVMKCFDPSQLPVLNTLAQEFVVCDHWFCSMPGPTEPNRFFSHAATSGAFDESPKKWEIFKAQAVGLGFEFKQGTVFHQLTRAGVKYRIYADDHFPVVAEINNVTVTPGTSPDKPIIHHYEFEDLATDLKDPSFDVGFVHIEPSYDALDSFEDGNSQHPNGSVAAGERFIKATYEAIRNSPLWEKSLLIITWDEHGGFYDHVPPPKATPTGERGRDHGFLFDQLGPRVPAIIVSPLIRRNVIEHKLFDHTAIPATIRRVFGLPPLGTRDGISGGVTHLAGFPPRIDAPTKLPNATRELAVERMPTSSKTSARRPDALLSDDPHGNLAALLHSAIVQHLQVTPGGQHAAIRSRVRQLKTHADAFEYLKEVELLLREKRALTGRRQD